MNLNHACILCRQTSRAILCRYCSEDSESALQTSHNLNKDIIDTLQRETKLSSITALGWYEWPINALIRLVKFQKHLPFCQVLTTWFMKYSLHQTDVPDAFIPMPANTIKQWFRGFNTPSILAAQFAQSLQRPVYHDVLKVRTSWWSQHALNRQKRLVRQHGFYCRPLPPSLKHIVIVDDIMTTGTTMHHAASALREVNPHIRISAWVIGVTRPPSSN